MIDVTSATLDISVAPGVLVSEIEKQGWNVTKVQLKKTDGKFVAEAKNKYKEKLERIGKTPSMALGNLYHAVVRHNYMRRSSIIKKVGAWEEHFVDLLPEIAEEYAEAPQWEEDAANAFKALADDCTNRLKVIKKNLNVEITDDPHPYKNVDEMIEDIGEKGRYKVSRANTDHPVWTSDQVIAYRTVHDILGHALSGGGYDWEGENMAISTHMPFLAPKAQDALFTEAIARTAYESHYRDAKADKVVIFPDLIANAQEDSNDGHHTGIHPSQTLARSSSSKHTPSEGEFHSSLVLPDGLVDKIKKAADEIEMDEREVPEEYHMTWLFIKDDNDHRGSLEGDHAEGNIEGSGEFKFTNPRVDTFPGREDGDPDTVIIRFDSEEARDRHDIWESNNSDQYDIDPGPFAGDYKPHITIGWNDGPVESKSLDDLEFTSEGFVVSPGAGDTEDEETSESDKGDYKTYVRKLYDGIDFTSIDSLEDIKEELKDKFEKDGIRCGDDFLTPYAYLAITKGRSTTSEDVHDAWSFIRMHENPDHKSVVWFDELDKETQEMDDPYRDGIHSTVK